MVWIVMDTTANNQPEALNSSNCAEKAITRPAKDAHGRPPGGASGGGVRVMLLGWSLWLLGSWLVVLMTTPSRTGAGWMALATLIGLVVMYPLVRFSLEPPKQAGRTVFNEVASMLGVSQAVIWPLMSIGHWGWASTLWLNGWIAGWSLLAAAVVVYLVDRGPKAQSMGMAVCLLMVLGEPTVAAVSRSTEDMLAGAWATVGLSPVPGITALTPVGGPPSLGVWPARVLSVLTAAAVAWAFVLLARRYQRPPKAASMLARPPVQAVSSA